MIPIVFSPKVLANFLAFLSSEMKIFRFSCKQREIASFSPVPRGRFFIFFAFKIFIDLENSCSSDNVSAVISFSCFFCKISFFTANGIKIVEKTLSKSNLLILLNKIRAVALLTAFFSSILLFLNQILALQGRNLPGLSFLLVSQRSPIN